jgi:positive regulator of sigma E activity
MEPRKDEPAAVQVGRYMGAGVTLAASTLLFLVVGGWVGEQAGSRDLGAVIGAFTGAAAGFGWLVRTLTEAGRKTRDRRDRR